VCEYSRFYSARRAGNDDIFQLLFFSPFSFYDKSDSRDNQGGGNNDY